MRSLAHRRSFAVLAFGALVTACATAESAYDSASRKGTVSAYRAFLQDHADSEYADLARAALARLEDRADYARAIETDSVPALERYLEKRPDGLFVDDVRRRLAERAYDAAEEEGTVAAYERYLAAHPDDARADAARGALERLEYEWAVGVDTEASLAAYLAKHPEGARSSEVREALESKAFAKVMEAPTPEGLRNFLERFPNGPNSGRAKTELGRLDYDRAIGTGTIEGYEAYLRHHPEGPGARDIEKRLSRLRVVRYAELVRGINLRRKGRWGELPLHRSAHEGEVELTRALLWKGADVDAAIERTGITALHLAAMKGHIDVVLALLESGATPCPREKYGLGPIDFAEKGGQIEALLEGKGCERSRIDYFQIPSVPTGEDGCPGSASSGQSRSYGHPTKQPTVYCGGKMLWFDFYDGKWKHSSEPKDPYTP